MAMKTLEIRTRTQGDVLAGITGAGGDRLAISAAGAITEANSAAIKTAVEAAQASLDTLDSVDFATSGKQDTANTHLDAIETAVEAAQASLDTLDSVDFATSAKQDTANTHLDAVETAVEAIANVDFATTAKQDAAKTVLDAIKTATEAGATSAKQDASKTVLDAIQTAAEAAQASLNTIDSVDFATSAKQDTANTALGTIHTDLGTIDGHLDGVEGALTSIDGHVDGIEGLLAGGLPAALSAGGGVKTTLVSELPAGTQNIGSVDVDSTPYAGAANAAAPAQVAVVAGVDGDGKAQSLVMLDGRLLVDASGTAAVEKGKFAESALDASGSAIVGSDKVTNAKTGSLVKALISVETPTVVTIRKAISGNNDGSFDDGVNSTLTTIAKIRLQPGTFEATLNGASEASVAGGGAATNLASRFEIKATNEDAVNAGAVSVRFEWNEA